MTYCFRSLKDVEDLAVLRPVILEYFQFISQQLRDHFGVTLAPESPVEAMYANPHKFLPPLGHTLVAEAEGQVLGTIAVKPLQGERVEIKRLYVRGPPLRAKVWAKPF